MTYGLCDLKSSIDLHSQESFEKSQDLTKSPTDFSWSETKIGWFCGVVSTSDKEHVVSASSAKWFSAASASGACKLRN